MELEMHNRSPLSKSRVSGVGGNVTPQNSHIYYAYPLYFSDYKGRNLCMCVLPISRQLFIRSTSHLLGVLLGTQGCAVLVQFGHPTRLILINFE